MCGIAGFLMNDKNNFINLSRLGKNFCENLYHRGPDDSGYWIDIEKKNLLAHTRLSILDLDQRSRQPMADEKNGLILVFNGELYNWLELKIKLTSYGYKFSTKSDTEVLLKGYQHWGTNILNRLEGMFSFGIYNRNTDELFCARDRIGKKPLVYSETNLGFAFASEIPLLIKNKEFIGLNPELDNSSIMALFGKNFRQISEPNSIYKNIKKIRPGHAIIVKSGKIKNIFRWWNPKEFNNNSFNYTSENLRDLLEKSIKLRCKADVEVGAFLSGGVDSSAIASISSRILKNNLKTYALGFDKNDEDIKRARIFSNIIKSDHKEFYFDPSEQWKIFEKIGHYNGEPLPLLPLVHTNYLCKRVKEDGLKVMLSGTGADELFYGYKGMVNTLLISMATKFLNPFLKNFSNLSLFQNEIGSILTKNKGNRKSSIYNFRSKYVNNLLLKDKFQNEIVDYNSIELSYWGNILPNENYIDESSFLGLIIENAASVAISGDLPAMMNGVEVRCPFLDSKIVEFAFGCHWSKKITPFSFMNNLKLILKESVDDILPKNLLHAPKRGFGHGISEKNVLLGPWKDHTRKILENFPNNTPIDPLKVKKLWKISIEEQNGPWDQILKLVSIGNFIEENYA